MYACVCQGVTEDDVRGHVASGLCSPKEVRAACGVRPGCGSCVRRICALIDEAESVSASDRFAAAG
ncbi:MAG: bacterioferritin-associated ferredoxin-like protein [Streptosporangiales bacterium]|nr:bacterioferritin-associated ferredoxin-like protein [Streptosporangiales bacterium]